MREPRECAESMHTRRRRAWHAAVIVALVTLLAGPGMVAAAGLGDEPVDAARRAGECRDDGAIGIATLVGCVGAALEGGPGPRLVDACDVDGDEIVTVDEVLAAVARAAASCRSPRTATATPTPTAMIPTTGGVDSVGASPAAPPARRGEGHGTPPAPQLAAGTPRPCAAVVLTGVDPIDRPGDTSGGSDAVNGVRCGTRGGGTEAPERVFEFVALVAGTYEISAQGEGGFSPLLSVRRDSCVGAYVGCAIDRVGNRPAIRTELAAGGRVAIVVDGDGRGVSGSFTLHIVPRRPDLVVTALTAPTAAAGGELQVVAAEVKNDGDAPAGPFTVEIGYARDAELTLPIGSTTVTCDIEGLEAGQVRQCQPALSLVVPLVKPSASYAIGAMVDARNVVLERNEGNNRLSRSTTITANGVELVHQLFRSDTGASYQVLFARPTLSPSQEESYLITSIAGSETGATGCMGVGATPGSAVSAIAGVSGATEALYPYRFVRRTTILEPSDARVRFSPTNWGALTLGGEATPLQLCLLDGGFCPGRVGLAGLNPLQSLIPAAPELLDDPIACIASAHSARCDGTAVRDTWTFGPRQSSGSEPVCSTVRSDATVCGIPETGGIPLHAGEAIVFVYGGSLDHDVLLGGALTTSGFSVSAAGFALDEDGLNQAGCPSGVLTSFISQAGFPAASPPPTPTPFVPPNDTCAAAIPIGAPPFSAVVNLTLATQSAGDPPTCFPTSPPVTNRNVWYSLYAPFAFRFRLEAVGEGAMVSAFAGACGALTPASCNTFQSNTVDFSVSAGSFYYFMVNAAGGDVAVRATYFF